MYLIPTPPLFMYNKGEKTFRPSPIYVRGYFNGIFYYKQNLRRVSCWIYDFSIN